MKSGLGKLEPICFWDWSKTKIFLRRYRGILPRLERKKILSKFRIVKGLMKELRVMKDEPDVLYGDLLRVLSVTEEEVREKFEKLKIGKRRIALEAAENGDIVQFWKIVLSKSFFDSDQELAIFSYNKKIKDHEIKKEAIREKFDNHRFDLSLTMYDVIKSYHVAANELKNLKTKNDKAFSILSDNPYAQAVTSDGSDRAYLCSECNLWILGWPIIFSDKNKQKKHFHCVICGMPTSHNDPCWVTC